MISVLSFVVATVVGLSAALPSSVPSSGAGYRSDSGSAGYFSRGSGAGYSGGGGGGGYSPSSGNNEEQKETKYYYGGKYQGTCVTDGLYYRDDTTFVICSNGYPHEQPCPPGTKTSGSPRYQPGYYYGYTDLCSVNLVDYGYGPEYYAPRGYPSTHDGYEGKASGREGSAYGEGRGAAGSGAYGAAGSQGYDRAGSVGGYGSRSDSTDYSSGYGSSIKNRKYDVSSVYGKKDVPLTYVGRDTPSRYPESKNPYIPEVSASKPSYSGSSSDYLSSKSRDTYSAQLPKSTYLDKY